MLNSEKDQEAVAMVKDQEAVAMVKTQEIDGLISQPDVVLSDEERNAIQAHMDSLSNADLDCIDAFVQFCRLNTAYADVLMQESKYLADRAKTLKARIEYTKNRMMESMIVRNIQNLHGNQYTVKLMKSTRVQIADGAVAKLPDDFVQIKTEFVPDKNAIKAAIKKGTEVPGCSLVESNFLRLS